MVYRKISALLLGLALEQNTWAQCSTESILHLIRKGRKQIAENLDYGDHWGVDGNTEAYALSFSRFLKEDTFAEWAKNRKQSGRTTHLLDIMGSGQYLDDYSSVDSITGVRLRPSREVPGPDTKDIDWKIIGADVFDSELNSADIEWRLARRQIKSDWHDVGKSMNERGIPSFDLITIRPLAGISGFENNERYLNYLLLLRKAYRKLSSQNGEMFIQLPRRSQDEYQKWVVLLRQHGIQVEYHEYKLHITRTPESANRLPVVLEGALNSPTSLKELEE